eukprot:TRINITY_DN9046_c0_g1_i3.p1 TRINITY_DN9046_c0_g1~~TRINITY_DN9046_c0_g1_i3.p1  ORF type:complete len:117 (+),score=2.37 TRINITY_DN9046_c0_g1_i3:206-556(+)
MVASFVIMAVTAPFGVITLFVYSRTTKYQAISLALAAILQVTALILFGAGLRYTRPDASAAECNCGPRATYFVMGDCHVGSAWWTGAITVLLQLLAAALALYVRGRTYFKVHEEVV